MGGYFSVGTAAEAKQRGKTVELRADWAEARLPVMRNLLAQKFRLEPYRSLLRAIDGKITEGNWWRDTFWGVDEKTGKGENHLGKILMKIRDELRAEEKTVR